MARWAGDVEGRRCGGEVSCLMDYRCSSSCSQSAVITRIWAIIEGEIRLCSFLPIKAVQLCRKELKVGQESRRAIVVSWILGFRGFGAVLLLSQRDGVRMPVKLSPAGEEHLFLAMTMCQPCTGVTRTEGCFCMLKSRSGFQGDINISAWCA